MNNYFRIEPVSRAEEELRMKRLKNDKETCKYIVTGKMIKIFRELVIDLVWELGNMTSEGVKTIWISVY